MATFMMIDRFVSMLMMLEPSDEDSETQVNEEDQVGSGKELMEKKKRLTTLGLGRSRKQALSDDLNRPTAPSLATTPRQNMESVMVG